LLNKLAQYHKIEKNRGFEKNMIRMSVTLFLCGYTHQVVLMGGLIRLLFGLNYNIQLNS